MPSPDALLQTALERFKVARPALIAQTPAARIYRVKDRRGRACALKLWPRGTPGNEAGAARYLSAMAGRGVVEVLVDSDNAVLMPWLDGPGLDRMVREGPLDHCDDLLAQCARQLHARPYPAFRGVALDTWFQALFDAAPARDSHGPLARPLRVAKEIGLALVISQPRARPLHGDLHHGNVIVTAHGPLAIDPKGLTGDPAYELANAFRHPRSAGQALCDPELIRARAALWSAALEVAEDRLLGWAVAKCALSLLWQTPSGDGSGPDKRLLTALISVWDDQTGR